MVGSWVFVFAHNGKCCALDAKAIDDELAKKRQGGTLEIAGLDVVLRCVDHVCTFRGVGGEGDAVRTAGADEKLAIRVCLQGLRGFRVCRDRGCARAHRKVQPL